MLASFNRLFETSGFMPHGHCFLWTPSLLWIYVVSDAVIAASYFSIPFALWYFVHKRQDLPYRWVFVMFGVFVMACGTTHLFAIWNIWQPDYWADAGVKGFTAVVSAITAIMLWPLIPRAVAIPSQQELERVNQELQNELERRYQAEVKYLDVNRHLEERIARRTAELQFKNTVLSTQQEASLDAMLVVDENARIISYNRQYVDLFRIPEELVRRGAHEPVLQLVIEQAEDPDQFLAKVRHLYEHKGEKSREEVQFKGGRTIDQYSAPVIGADGKYYGRVWYFRDITEHKRAEEELLRFRIAMETSLDGIFLMDFETFRYLDVNETGCSMLGYSREELLTMRTMDTNLDISEADQRQRFEAARTLGSAHVMMEPAGRFMRRKDGSTFPVEVARRYLRIGEQAIVVGIARDITERRRSEQALRESEAKYRQLIEQASDGVFITDSEGNYILVNSRGCELLGYPETELLGLNARDTYIEEEREIHAMRIAQVRTGETLRFERMVRRKDGSTFFAEISSKVIDNGLIQVIFHDITERRNQEQKIARLSRIQEVLSGINSAIVRIRNRQELFKEACRIAVEHGGFTIGWIATLDQASGKLVPVAQAGLPVDLGAGGDSVNRPVGLVPGGPAEVALRERRPAFDNDIDANPDFWNSRMGPDTLSVRRAAIRLGANSVIVLPLFVERQTFGVLTLYAPERNFFDDEEIKLLTELAGDISFGLEYIAKEEKADYLAYYDPLTDLPNRSLFSERLSQQLHTRADSPELVAVALIDVERLRLVNDSLGRQAGDDVLRLIARRLESNVAMTHWSNPARVVGDSFGVIIRGVRDASELAQLIEQGLKACFGVPFVIEGKEIRLDARAGVSAYPTDGSTAESLLRNAESALRNAKRTTERFVFYAPEINAQAAEFLLVETKLHKAIELEQFVLHYQPKFDAATGKTTGVEALIRWNDPDTGMVPPLQFIHILEETGMIFEVGRWALRQGLADQQRWRGKGLTVPRVAVNVSAQQLRDQHFVQDVQLALASQEGLMPALELEITESLLMEDIERNIERLKTLRDLGVTIAIDDFGTGYSSLNYLARLPMDTLKVDRSFVLGMLESPVNRTIVSTIISLAHSLGLKVIAEGVETEEQLNLLRLLKCDEVQGFLLSRPVAFDKIPSFLGR